MSTSTAWNPTAAEYHADTTRVSHSMCEVFRRSRKEYYRRFVTREMEPPAQTEAMRFGSLVHQFILEPDTFADTTAVAPICDRRTKDGKARWAAFCEASGGKQIITQADLELLKCIAGELRQHPVAWSYIIGDGAVESVVTWTDESTGLSLKARFDKVTDEIILDLKTCADASPEGFAKACATRGYHRQAAHYIEAEIARTGERKPFVFIAVEKEPPFEVGVYVLDDDALTLGLTQNQQTRRMLVDCYDEQSKFIALHERSVAELKLPKWAEYADQYLYGD